MDALWPLLSFVLVTSITPGPNNLLLAASGSRFGVWRSLPHVLGIHAGVYLLVLLCAAGAGRLLTAAPAVPLALKVFGSVYLLYLTWQIVGLRVAGRASDGAGRPMRSVEALAFQFANPKAWIMVVTGLNLALAPAGGPPSRASLLLIGTFLTVGLVCNVAWLAAGASLQRVWEQGRSRRLVNGVLAGLCVLAVVGFWVPGA